MQPSVILLCSLLAYTSASSVSFRASPSLAVEGITEELSFQCKSPSSVNRRVHRAFFILIERTDVNGTKSLVAAQSDDELDYERDAENRTSAKANIQQSETDEGSFLDVTIKDPTEADTGTYECRFLYVDVNFKVFQPAAVVNITVTEVPPPNYSPQVVGSLEERGECGCEELYDEIDDIKATLVMENERLRDQVGSYDETCKVSFSAQFGDSSATQIKTGDVVFDVVTNNKGDAYDGLTGIFTAPCAGQYFFTLTLRSFQSMDSGYVYGIIMVDESAVARTAVFTDAPYDNYQSASNSAVVSLKAGQQVKVTVRSTSSGQFMAEDFSIFSGFFLFP